MIGGFTNYAHLRLRDHRPGNGDYELPPSFGPASDSSKRSILGRHYAPLGEGESCSVGPCAYDVPSTIGTGRAARFASPLPNTHAAPTPTGASRSASGGEETREVALPAPAPKQYSMALCPDTPSYSLYGRLKSEWEQQSSYASPGPAAYAVAGHFDHLNPELQAQHPSSGVVPGVHLGTRTELPGARAKDDLPGPGAYNLVRFGDEVPRSREPVLSRRRRPRGVHAGPSTTPGPGAYDDPSSIGYRAAQAKAKRLFAPSSTFGGRWKGREYHTAGPGPAAYNTLHAAKLLEKDRRHPPKFAATQPALTSRATSEAGRKKASEASSTQSAPPPTTLPSDFDYDYKKGKSILGKWHVPAEAPQPAPVVDAKASGPGYWESPLPRGGRFAAGPYNPSAQQLAEAAAKVEAARAAEAARQLPGPGAYQAQSSLTERRAPAALFGHTSSAKFANADNGVPGPGHYRTVDDGSIGTTGQGTVFYKGDFHPRGGYRRPSADEADGGGPGAHYNDDTMYSRSINGDRVSDKGYTMGIRYPARATYQCCAPYDETTNINCVYPDEQTWETKPKLRLPPVPSAKS